MFVRFGWRFGCEQQRHCDHLHINWSDNQRNRLEINTFRISDRTWTGCSFAVVLSELQPVLVRSDIRKEWCIPPKAGQGTKHFVDF